MSKFDWDFTLPESVIQLQDTLNRIETSALAISAIWEDAITHFDFSELFAAAANIGKTFSIISDQASQLSSIATSIVQLVDPSVFAPLINTQAITTALSNIDWSWIAQAQEQASTDGIEPVAEDLITEEIRAEMAADIADALSNPKEAGAISQSKYLQWKERHPGLAAFFLDILYPFLLVLIGALISQHLARPVKNSKVYEDPVATSNVVYNVTVENNITIIDEVPYYYKVEFPNPETGELVTGYIYKGNLSEATSDSTEPSEPEETSPSSTEPLTEATE